MEDASALYAAQPCARRLNTAREAVRLYGADHERITITALLRSAWEGRRSALRGGGEAGSLLGASSTQVLLDGVPLRKRPTDRGFAPRVHFRLKTSCLFRAKTPHQKPITRRKIHHLWGIFLSARPRMSRHILDGYSKLTYALGARSLQPFSKCPLSQQRRRWGVRLASRMLQNRV
jgi:hypothetical protein